jgi:hypothetical protein
MPEEGGTGFQSSIPGPVGDVTLAYLAITVTGNPRDFTVLDAEIAHLADSMEDDIVEKDVDGVITAGTGP